MGKRIISQRRGRGTTTYTANSHRYVTAVKHRKYDEIEKTGAAKGKVIDIINCPGHSAPLAKINYENGEESYILAPNKIKVNDYIYSGIKASLNQGNTLPLEKIPDGTLVYNLELKPGDGGKLVRASGTFARVLTRIADKILVELPSKKQKSFSPLCRATIGIIAGSGRLDKPLLKAGKKHHMARAKGKLYPRTSGVAMNAVDHPFGSGRGRHVGKPKTAPRFAPPGRKVGLIKAKRTGKRS